MKAAVQVDQGFAVIALACGQHFAQEGVMRALVVNLDHAAIEVGQRLVEHRRTGRHRAPLTVFEAGIAVDAFDHAGEGL